MDEIIEDQNQGTGEVKNDDGNVGSEGNGSGEVGELKKKLEEAEMKINELTGMCQMALADLQNYRRRMEEEKVGLIAFANAGLVSDLLPLVNNMQRAIEHQPEVLNDEVRAWVNGVVSVMKDFEKFLSEKGVKMIETVGKKFDPVKHEALISVEGESDIVVAELERGFMFGDKVLKRAKVSVGNGQVNKGNFSENEGEVGVDNIA